MRTGTSHRHQLLTIILLICAGILAFTGLISSTQSGIQHHQLIVGLISSGVLMLTIFIVVYRTRIDAEWKVLLERQKEQRRLVVRLASHPAVVEGDIQQACRAITEMAADALSVERVNIWFLEENGKQLRCVDLFERAARKHSAGTVLHAAEYPRYFEALMVDRAVDAHDACTDPRTSELVEGYLKPHKISSMLDAAIRISGTVVGIVCLEHVGKTRMWIMDEVSFAAEMADQIGQAILNGEKRKAQLLLKESEAKYRNLVETSHDLIWTVDREGRLTYLNRQAVKTIYGYEPDEMIGRLFSDFVAPEHQAKDLQAFEQIKTGTPFSRYETVHRRKDGSPVYLLINAITLRNDQGEMIGSTGTATDITQRIGAEDKRIELEQQLRQSQKMEALGRLAGGIAHDFNNILGAIIGYSELVKGDLNPAQKEIHSQMDYILSAGSRAKDLVAQILTFSRRAERIESAVKLGEVISEVLNLIKVSLPARIRISWSQVGEPQVLGDQNQLYQMVMNLCTNAIYAMQERGGELRLDLKVVDAGEMPNAISQQLPAGAYTLLVVQDTGVGIPPDVQERVFEPFFTTKSPGEGTGLGLAVVHGIVEGHGGKVLVHSTEGKGTTFEIYLPVAHGEEVQQVREPSRELSGNERILVVDDEETLALLGKEMLERFGYQVTAVTSPQDALKLFSEEPHRFDLLITDLAMSSMSGEELIIQIRNMEIDIPVILCSGYLARNSEMDPGRIAVAARLSKPYTTRTLLGAVRKVLDDARNFPDREKRLTLH